MPAPVSKSELTQFLLATLYRVASGESYGVSIITTNAKIITTKLANMCTEYNLTPVIMIRPSLSPNEVYILNKETAGAQEAAADDEAEHQR